MNDEPVFILFRADGTYEYRSAFPKSARDREHQQHGEHTYVHLIKFNEWYRIDLTPVLLSDVPQVHRTTLLLLT